MRSWPTRNAGWLSGFALILLPASIAAIGWEFVQMRENARMAVEQTRHFMAARADVKQEGGDPENRQRGFLLPGDPFFPEPVTDALSREPAHPHPLRHLRRPVPREEANQ